MKVSSTVHVCIGVPNVGTKINPISGRIWTHPITGCNLRVAILVATRLLEKFQIPLHCKQLGKQFYRGMSGLTVII